MIFFRLFLLFFIFSIAGSLAAQESKKIHISDSMDCVLQLWGQPTEAKTKEKKSIWSYIPEKSSSKLEHKISATSSLLKWKSRNLHILFENGKVVYFVFLKTKALGF